MLVAYCSYEKLQLIQKLNPTSPVHYTINEEAETSVIVLVTNYVIYVCQNGVLPDTFVADFPAALKVGALSW